MIFVDAHVHLRRCFSVASFLEKARANFEREAHRFGRGGPFDGVLCVVDSPHEDGFERLLACSKRRKSGGLEGRMKDWQFRDTAEETSIRLTAGERKNVIIVAGHQLASQEGLEVLAVGTRNHIESDRPADCLVRTVAQAEGLPVVPWGVGKWLGARRDIVRRLIRDAALPQFFLGDSANRPPFWPLPSPFELAEEAGIRNLPGSDPLPVSGEEQCPGSFGVALEGTLDARRPVRDLKERLLDHTVDIRHFGHRKSLLRFVRSQIVMQYRRLAE